MQDRVVSSNGVPSPSSAPLQPSPASRPSTCANGVISLLNQVCLGILILAACLLVANVTLHATVQPDPNNVLLDFSATWCGPCQQMSPIVSKLERQGYPIRKVDIDDERALASRFQISSIPCFVLVVNGKEVTRLVGPRDEKELKQLMLRIPRQDNDDLKLVKTEPNAEKSKHPEEGKKPFPRLPKLFPKMEPANNQAVAQTFRGQSPNLEPTNDGPVANPMASSVRIRIKDGTRIHYGSGTVIESEPGRSLIVTCGHVFRDLKEDAVVEVDVYAGSNSAPQTLPGQVLTYDLDCDLGLLAISTRQVLPVIKLCQSAKPLATKERVFSIGCGGGEHPTREEHVVTAINRYKGPDNVECNGVPQQGRSGGGLFLGSELVGVCIAADPKDKRGIYTGLKPICQLLAKAKLSHLVPRSMLPAEESIASEPVSDELAVASPLGDEDSEGGTLPEPFAGLISTTAREELPTGAAADYVGAEIVCVVRPKTPGAVSRIVIVNQASARLVDDLLHEAGGRPEQAPRTAGNRREPRSGREDANFSLQAPATDPRSTADLPIETSFEPQRYRRQRD